MVYRMTFSFGSVKFKASSLKCLTRSWFVDSFTISPLKLKIYYKNNEMKKPSRTRSHSFDEMRDIQSGKRWYGSMAHFIFYVRRLEFAITSHFTNTNTANACKPSWWINFNVMQFTTCAIRWPNELDSLAEARNRTKTLLVDAFFGFLILMTIKRENRLFMKYEEENKIGNNNTHTHTSMNREHECKAENNAFGAILY